MGALEKRADELYHNLAPADKEFVRRLFLELVQLGEDRQVTRRRVTPEHLRQIADSTEQCQRTIRLLADREQRLIVTDRNKVEVAHEALLSDWRLLVSWIEADRENLRFNRRLSADAREWEASYQKSEEALLAGAKLEAVAEWVERTNPRLLELEREFFEKSVEKRDRDREAELERERQLRRLAEEKAKAEAELRQLAEAKAELEAERAKQEKARARVTIGASILFTITALAFVESWSQFQHRLLADSWISPAEIYLQQGNQLEAMMASVKALDALENTVINRRSLVNTTLNTIITQIYEYNRLELPETLNDLTGIVKSVSFHPQNGQIVTAHEKGNIILWSQDGSQLDNVPQAHSDMVWEVRFNDDGSLLASGGKDGKVKLWKIEDRKLVEAETFDSGGPVYGLSFSPDNKAIAASGRDGIIKIWSFNNDSSQQALEVCNEAMNLSQENSTPQNMSNDINSINFHPTDRTVIAYSNEVGIVSLCQNNRAIEIGRHPDGVAIVRFNRDGDRLASASYDGVIKIWEKQEENWNPVGKIETGEYNYGGLAFSPNGKFIISSGTDEVVKLWNVDEMIQNFNTENTLEFQILGSHQSWINSIDTFYDRNSNFLMVASASHDRTVKLWKINTNLTPQARDLHGLLEYSCQHLEAYLNTTNKENLPNWFENPPKECL
ncbi:MAG: hypothetical protein J7642_01855 [Cyanobacteria bacterium SBC]|nr:hypothetical protein [Cyanobacteria bacterium SBC]